MAESLVQSFLELFQDKIPPELTVFLISLLPILELRGGLIAAQLLGMNLLPAFVICFIGNLLPIPFILLFIKKIFQFLKDHTTRLKNLVEKLEKRAYSKSDKVEKYKQWGLLLFVAIPLPGTGGWTGALVAAMLEMPIKKSFPVIALGVFIAGIIMSVFSFGLLGALGIGG